MGSVLNLLYRKGLTACLLRIISVPLQYNHFGFVLGVPFIISAVLIEKLKGAFDKVYEELGADVAFLMIDLVDGQRETVESGARHIEEQGYSFPVFFDVSGEAGNVYGISSIPTTVFIDKDGYIITGAIGALTEQTLRLGIGYITLSSA